MGRTYLSARPAVRSDGRHVYRYRVDCPCGCGGYNVSLTYYKTEITEEQQNARFSAPMNYLTDVHDNDNAGNDEV